MLKVKPVGAYVWLKNPHFPHLGRSPTHRQYQALAATHQQSAVDRRCPYSDGIFSAPTPHWNYKDIETQRTAGLKFRKFHFQVMGTKTLL